MNIAIIGATGWIGSTLMQEALSRQLPVTALVRDPAKLSGELAGQVTARVVDLEQGIDPQVFEGIDLVIASVGGRASGQHQLVPQSAKALLELLPKTQVKRLLWVGGAGSLELAPGQTLVQSPGFPPEYRDEALAQGEALEVFRESDSPLNWTFVSPAAEIYPGASEGAYRIGGDRFFTDEEGRSRISVADYAKAMLDLIDSDDYARQRISVAY
ncbi:NAD(P)-dependent oxidoreductase [Shewanella alkalitolerans]|uniref:NAD(P)-dependent oxidoreductase n=1 Tax=Shewanella alkalitolerans TaxID=2864209 RepID=UPI001C65C640|nr:NAD(P)-dependent oxidoreductase [Shewanella alkalitolerans]QYJ98450.1 NAD(P)-dependent oxidoreductase [Shewanella alkalitolerans]